MRLPVIQGIIRRRILANYRVDPEIMQRQLPARFRPKLQNGMAVAGICLIRLEHIRPRATPEPLGLASENAAHRVAVLWEDGNETREGVFICRRDTDSRLNYLLGGRIFPGEHHAASFSVTDSDKKISLRMESRDAAVQVMLEAEFPGALPASSAFSSLEEASTFFQGGSTGYSVTSSTGRLDGLELQTAEWKVEPINVTQIYSSHFADESKFPRGTIEFDHALIMRNVEHEWHSADDLYV
jgi:uncharacterized protein YqjF (DUF2071 family)